MAHTGFPIHIPEGFLKETQSPSSKFQRRTACPPSQTVCSGDTLRPVLLSRDENKTTEWRQIRLIFPSKPKAEFHNDNESQHIYITYVAYKVNTIRIFTCPAQMCFHKVHYGSKHNFSPEADGQKQDTLPPCQSQTACPLCFIRSSKIH